MVYGYKEIDPLKTIEQITDFLKRIGVKADCKWYPSDINNIYSVRVSIIGTNYGANGKGISKEYALASAYGELIERMANGIIFKNGERSATKDVGYTYFPDEECLSKEYFYNEPNEIVNGILDIISVDKYNSCAEKLTREQAMQLWEKYEIKGNWLSVPFRGVRDNRNYYVPYKMMQVYGSNGMSAGNSYNEAFVQGCSEIFERYCQITILENKLCPPTIPTEIIKLQFNELYNIVSEIESKGKFYIEFRDCSLNKGFPVVCVCIYDKENHTETVSFGAHPDISIAMERALTEAFQGRNLNNICFNLTTRGSDIRINTLNIIKNGLGYYPFSFYSNKQSYPCTVQQRYKKFPDNNALKNEIIKICDSNKLNIYVHAVSLATLSCLHIIIPGLSEVYCYDKFQFDFKQMKDKTKCILSDIDNYSPSLVETTLEFIDYCRKTSDFDLNLSKEIVTDMSDDKNQKVLWLLINGFVYLGHFNRAITYLKLSDYKDKEEGKCFAKLLELLTDGIDLNTAKDILNKFFDGEYVSQAEEILQNAKNVISNSYTNKSCTNEVNPIILNMVREIKKEIRLA